MMMRCPCCKCEIVITHEDRYESIEEHVFSPDSVSSLKSGFQCTNRFCIANNLGCVWTSDGEIYIDTPDKINTVVAHDVIKKCNDDGIYYALDSWAYNYEHKILTTAKLKRSFSIFNYKIDILPVFHTPVQNGKYIRKRFSLKFEFWKKTKDETYTHLSPVLRMVRYNIGIFNRSYKKEHWDACNNQINGYTPHKKPDNRLFARISSRYIRIFHPFKCKRVLNEVRSTRTDPNF